MDIMRVPIVLDDRPNSSRVKLVPGAHNDERVGENVDIMMTQVINIHFCDFGQFLSVSDSIDENYQI